MRTSELISLLLDTLNEEGDQDIEVKHSVGVQEDPANPHEYLDVHTMTFSLSRSRSSWSGLLWDTGDSKKKI